MSQKSQTPSQDGATLSRRRMFAGVGGMGALAAAAAVLPMTKAELPAVAATQADTSVGGYQLTEHVKRYYQTART